MLYDWIDMHAVLTDHLPTPPFCCADCKVVEAAEEACRSF